VGFDGGGDFGGGGHYRVTKLIQKRNLAGLVYAAKEHNDMCDMAQRAGRKERGAKSGAQRAGRKERGASSRVRRKKTDRNSDVRSE